MSDRAVDEQHIFEGADDDAAVFCPDHNQRFEFGEDGAQINYCPYCGGVVGDDDHSQQSERPGVICKNTSPGAWAYCPGCGGDRVELLTDEIDGVVVGYLGVSSGQDSLVFCEDCGPDVNRTVTPLFGTDVSSGRSPACRSCTTSLLPDEDLYEEKRSSVIELIGHEVGIDDPGTSALRISTHRKIAQRLGLETQGSIDQLRQQLRGYFSWGTDTTPMQKGELVRLLRILRKQEVTHDE